MCVRRVLFVFLGCAVFLVLVAGADAAVRYVTQDGAGSKDGSGWENSFGEAEFRPEIASADAGVEFWVAAGVYRPVIPADATAVTADEKSASFVLKEGVSLYGGFAGNETERAARSQTGNVTVLTGDLANDDAHDADGVTANAANISGDNSACVVVGSGVTTATILDGFTVTAGSNPQNGGGMYNDAGSPTITNCAFAGNYAGGQGGGMYGNNSSPEIANCVFSENIAFDDGGGMCNNGGSPTVTDCSFLRNRTLSDDAGGMYNDASSPTVTRCVFLENRAVSSGGAVYTINGGSPALTECAFSGNSASQKSGGAIYNTTTGMTVSRSTFTENSAAKSGGAIYSISACAIENCTFSGNVAVSIRGGGVATTGGAIANCTFTGNIANSGGGLCNYANTVVTNCIFWNNSGGEIVNFSGTPPQISFCVVSGDDIGTGTVSSDIISADPLLGPLAWNGGSTQTHALFSGSSAIDKGTTIPTISCDQRGVARPQGSAFDIGAYECGPVILTVEITGSGSVTRDPSGDVIGDTGKCWSYPNGTVVALTAVDGARGFFATWSGDTTGTAKTATVTMSCDHAVEAVFDPAWIITVSAGVGGDITESAPGAGSSGLSAPGGRGAGTTEVKVRNGADKTFTVTPDAGYSIGPVRVDGVIKILGAGSPYTFTNVSADHTLEATFTANPTPTLTPIPSATPAPTAAPTPIPSVTPTPFPTPDPDVPLPTVTISITLYAGGTLVAGPFDITNPATLTALLSSQTLLAQLLAADPGAILSGTYNMDLVRFFSLIADLDDGVLDFTILFEVKVDNVPAGYRAQVFVLTRTFDADGNPTGYVVIPRDVGASVFRKRSGARGWTETWRVTIRDGGVTDGDARQDGSVAPQIAAVVAVFPMATPTVTMTPTQGSTGSGGGCSLPANGSAAFAALLFLAPVLISRRR